MRRYYDDDEEDEVGTIKDSRTYRRQSARRVYDEDDDDDEGIVDEEDFADELVSLLKSIDYTRQRLDCHQSKLSHLLERYPEFAGLWQKFQKAGGLSAEDFRLFLKGELRPRITRQRKHLRLVSSRKPLAVKLKRPGNNDAA
jgi:hypothetical protein